MLIIGVSVHAESIANVLWPQITNFVFLRSKFTLIISSLNSEGMKLDSGGELNNLTKGYLLNSSNLFSKVLSYGCDLKIIVISLSGYAPKAIFSQIW